ncbi:hypothetical protein BDV93DRAFT_453963 [Ceratobasidium sp. AG-I]|nr:hypothetical protein BDV93DRAFT_453963 [Ceratobasidium sp. AG-I]
MNRIKWIFRLQFPLTAAYSFMDHRSRGQTAGAVIVDIGGPPSGGITPFSAYVALSCSSGHNTILLLQNFIDTLFTKVPFYKLVAEDGCLREFNTSALHT